MLGNCPSQRSSASFKLGFVEREATLKTRDEARYLSTFGCTIMLEYQLLIV